MKTLFTLAILCMYFAVGAQTDSAWEQQNQELVPSEQPLDTGGDIYEIVEEIPSYPGGETAMKEFIVKKMVYPDSAFKNSIEGRVYIQFIVERDGSLSNIKAVKRAHPLLDEEAVRVIKLMPKWLPGKQRGKPVRVKVVLPIVFKLKS